MSLKTEFLGLTLESPFILGSGPLSYGGEGIIRAHRAGAGAVVTKTIRDNPAVNPYPHMAVTGRGSMINAEEWADIPGNQWIETEIPMAKEQGAVVIASIGHTPEEAEKWVPLTAGAGADALELVSYTEEAIVPMIRKARKLTDKPILVKISPNWKDPVQAALNTIEEGADGITAMDSVGPVLGIDIATGKPLVGSSGGFGWLTGKAIKPVALRYVAEISMKTGKPVLGLGGVENAGDAVEMLMAGASAVGICTAPIVRGVEYITRLNLETEKLMRKLDYGSVSEISGLSHRYLRGEANFSKYDFSFNPETCTSCMACVKACAYEARTLKDLKMTVDESRCRYCGLCFSVCPNGSLRRKNIENS